MKKTPLKNQTRQESDKSGGESKGERRNGLEIGLPRIARRCFPLNLLSFWSIPHLSYYDLARQTSTDWDRRCNINDPLIIAQNYRS